MPALHAIGDTIRLTAVPLDADGEPVPGVNVSWSSDDPGVAEVDPQGLLTAAATGTTRVRASVGDVSEAREIRVEADAGSSGLALQAPEAVTAGTVVQLRAFLGVEGETPGDSRTTPVAAVTDRWTGSGDAEWVLVEPIPEPSAVTPGGCVKIGRRFL